MSLTYPANRLRIRLDVKREAGSAVDAFSSASPSSYWGAALQVELALDENGELLDTTTAGTVYVEMKPFDDRGQGALIPAKAATAYDATLTEETWAEGSSQHVLINFTGAEIKTIDMNGATELKIWCVVWGNTQADVPVVWGVFILTLVDSGASI